MCEDDFGPLGTSYSTVMSRAKASLVSNNGSSDRTLNSHSSAAAPHTSPRLKKKNSAGVISLRSIPEERLEMQFYDFSDSKPRNFKKFSFSSCHQNFGNPESEIEDQSVLNVNQQRRDNTPIAGEQPKKKCLKVSTTSFMPDSIKHTNENLSTKPYRRASLEYGPFASKNSFSRKKPPLVKKLSFPEPLESLPFLGEILTSGSANNCNMLGSTNFSINPHLEEISELSSLLSVQNSTSLSTGANSSLAEHKTKSTDIQSRPLNVTELSTSKCNAASDSFPSEILINSSGNVSNH
ncbi:hypothetical protein FHG87_023258 [Trinorchestia longiramus]|nr:hypothetical protein FHG87_023258 [Trinorchestia longiramus]